MKTLIICIFLILFILSSAFSADIKGIISDAATEESLPGANVIIAETFLGASSDMDGYFNIMNVPPGEWQIEITYIGYEPFSASVTVGDDDYSLDAKLSAVIYKTQDIIVEASKAKERETPVAFTDIKTDEIEKMFIGQDVPHLFKNTPGIYVTSDGGSGLGDSKTYIRGFDEQRISVMINNIEVNDPESKKVYWSNWGALPGGAQSIQVQRGAGSTLYGAGTFGGSINVLTQHSVGQEGVEASAMVGNYDTYKMGIAYNTGLMASNTSFLGKLNYMVGNGWRKDTHYRGLQYYFAFGYYPNEQHTFNVVLHGAPQYHAYAYYSMPAKDFARYGRNFNPHPYVQDNDPGLTGRELDGTKLGDILFMKHNDKDAGGEVTGNGITSFDNNVYHKPQLEVHHTWDISKNTYMQTTVFGSLGRGYGENVNAYYKLSRNSQGEITMADLVDIGEYQYRAYSIHNQVGLVSTYNTKVGEHSIVAGAEARYWWARHYGLIVNTFGEESIGYRIGGTKGQFRESDVYYDYTGVKPNYSVFGHGLWKFGQLSIMTDLQYSMRKYHIEEFLPSNNNRPDPNGTYRVTQNLEGGNNDGYVNIPDTTYSLVDYRKSYNFLSPKFGVNYNVNREFNVFANVSRTYNEPRVKYFFNYGQPREDLKEEISTDFEVGIGYATQLFDGKINVYRIDFENKAFRVTDPTKANQPGYDYKGRRYVPVGEARYQGFEFSGAIRPYHNLEFGAAVTFASNQWVGEITKEAAEGLGIKEGNTEPEYPQNIYIGTVNYVSGDWFASLAARHFNSYYILSSNDPLPVEWDLANNKAAWESPKLPAWTVVDIILGYKLNVGETLLNFSLHMHNILDEEYWQIGNEYGVLPGPERNVFLNVAIGM